ncbi:DNA translocase FtsK [Bacillus sp. HMF5848]|uniref:DNA translocase FtsK n=1 Tax=Bacillus sp. HMF5848 TaxID=2495421 RepID=UPI000F7A1539|nr:DNA translocase FtsK [Bacillus sp. HMF5848]RSK27088.1 DNA translocase FtsK [Bacillus sp. HMF5848]
MAAKKKRKKTRQWKHTLQYEISGLLLMSITIIGILKLGIVGNSIVHVLRFFSGEWYMLFLIGFICLAIYFIWKRSWPRLLSRQMIGIYIIVISILLLSHVTVFSLLTYSGTIEKPSVIANTWDIFWMEINGEASTIDLGGGMLGAIFFAIFYLLFDEKGTKLIASLLIVIGFVLITGKSLQETVSKISRPIFMFIKHQWLSFVSDLQTWIVNMKEKRSAKKQEKQVANQAESSANSSDIKIVDENTIEMNDVNVAEAQPIISNFTENINQVTSNDVNKVSVQKDKQQKHEEETQEPAALISFVEQENEKYELPNINILKLPKENTQSQEHDAIYANARKLERTFQSFGVKAKVTKVHVGPAVTKYEVYPDVGVKVSKIVSLSDDLALALAAKDIRIEAPIPGKSAVGIEVPNSEIAVVSLREVLQAKENNRPDAKLLLGFGRDITGEAVLAELNKMPHLLVAGATGSGKSVCINGIIVSILMRAKPHEVKMMMIDPKMVELNVYNGIPHLLAPVVTDPKKASQALKRVVSEMERRYELFSHTGTRNIESYNEYLKRINEEEEDKQPTLPYIVVIVDELADLMMVASSDVEDSITRLAQMARAAGIHLIIATQRPSVDVITGVIKANIPSRIAFSVSSQTDSRTILDMGGAEKLLGRGDMLFLPVGASKPVRVQGAFLSDDEVEDIVDFVISQQKAQYQEEMIIDESNDIAQETEVDDVLFDDAVQLVVDMQTASVSMLQRRFRIGYTRAARLIDTMEAKGIVGPYEGSKPRVVLIQKNVSQEEAN